MKRKKIGSKSRIVCSARIAYPLVFSLLLSSCSYYGGQFSYFDLNDDNHKTLENRKATEKFWASVRPKSNLSDAHYRLGLHYQQMGEYDKAIGEFNKALRNDKSYCKALNGIAMTYDLQKRCEPAHTVYEQAVKCAPSEAYVYNNYACSSLFCGNYGKGTELLLKAESLAASDTRIKNNLRIARTIAIRENISEYFKSGNTSQPAISGQAPASIDEKNLAYPVQTVPEGIPNTASSQEKLSEMPADIPAEPVKEIAIQLSAQEIAPAPLQVAKASNPVVEESKIIEVSAPAFSSPVKVAVEVSNGNGTIGMAKRSADFLRGKGFTVRSITNAQHFRFEESTIYYKEEYLQTAKNLAAVIPGPQNLERVETLSKTSIGIKVVLGRDLSNMGFPEGYAGLADYRQTEKLQPYVLIASNIPVHY